MTCHKSKAAANATATAALASVRPACKISMLWNWETIDTCFLAKSWQITSSAGFAGSAFGLFLLVVAIEFVRRAQREYDAFLGARKSNIKYSLKDVIMGKQLPNVGHFKDCAMKRNERTNQPSCNCATMASLRPTWPEQTIRSLFYMAQFSGAFIVMLIGMYFNGYMLICIFSGAFVGHLLFAPDTIMNRTKIESGTSCC